ncbi:hypothetical protein EV363DRAFT_602002 [Boletus edulis]|nr:hypothetical protein EV363DRAFT_602002 [Boletus edulis]
MSLKATIRQCRDFGAQCCGFISVNPATLRLTVRPLSTQGRPEQFAFGCTIIFRHITCLREIHCLFLSCGFLSSLSSVIASTSSCAITRRVPVIPKLNICHPPCFHSHATGKSWPGHRLHRSQTLSPNPPDSVEEGGIANDNDARGPEAALESIVASEVDYVFFNSLKGLAMREGRHF